MDQFSARLSRIRVLGDDAWRRVQASKAPYSADEYAAAGRTIRASPRKVLLRFVLRDYFTILPPKLFDEKLGSLQLGKAPT